MEEAKARIRKKTSARKFIAYFQSFTNTYGDVKRLHDLYERVICLPEVVILSIGTRPDCLGEEVMRMLVRLNAVKPVWVELGLQTIHDKTAEQMNRGYRLPVFCEAVRKLKAAGIQVIVHVIFGLPGETKQMMMQTVHFLAEMDPLADGVKIQMLNIPEGQQTCGRVQQTSISPIDIG